MRLRTQFLISLVVFALIFAVIASSVFLTNLRLAELRSQRNISSAVEVDASILGYLFINYFLYQQNSTDWQAMVSQLYTETSNLNSTTPEEQVLVNKVLFDLASANNTFNRAMLALNGTSLNQAAGGITMFEQLWSNITRQVEQLSFDADQLSRFIDQQTNDTNQTNSILIVVLVGLFAAYFLLMYQLVFKRTLQSIYNLRLKTKTISQGNLNYPAEKQRNDEIGELSSDVDSMVSNLKHTTASKEELEKEVNERKKAQAALQEAQNKLREYANDLEKLVEERTKKIVESEQSYRELYESFGEAFIATDWELTIIHWNKAAERITRVKAQDALGKKVYEVLPEMMTVDVTPYYEALANKQPARFMMNTVSRETSRNAIFEVSTYPSTQGIIIIVEDKTEEEQTKRLSAVGQTAGMVGHDIRNPLQAITSDVYLIREELKDIPQCSQLQGVRESLSSIEENIFYINKIVSDLQDYTRPIAPQHKPANVKELLVGTVATGIPKTIETDLQAPEDLEIFTDPEYLKRILNNLVTNAVQAMPKGGKLTLQAQKKGAHVVFSVKDTGGGIPEGIRDKIFTPLFTTKSKGQGLGLAVVKRLVDGLGGNITFVSQEGKGTEFNIELPIR
jgi:two-component system, sporulation sensor kinase E